MTIADSRVVKRKDGIAGVDRMWDSQWVSVVNHDNCYRDWSKEDAIAHAVKLTEQYMASEFAKQLVALQSRLDAVGRLADSLVGQADDAYVRYIGALNTDECKGQQFKLHNGKFGEAELEAHKKAASLFAKHRELMAAANELRAALGGESP